ncbi:MAG TPA: hypothetical protein VE074_13895 [Jatrophihabitantaceae bacterium]|nr:hypothetical protein [Jatrophihabitantaceae bacterium]
MLLGRGFGDDFERDNFDYVQAAVAATPPAQLVVARPAWEATPFAATPPTSPALKAIKAVAAQTIRTIVGSPPAVAAPAPAPPLQPTMVGYAPPVTSLGPGPNVAALRAQMSAAGVTTDGQAATWLSSLDGNPAPNVLTEDSAAYYLDALARKAQRSRWTMVAIAGVAGVGLLLLVRR